MPNTAGNNADSIKTTAIFFNAESCEIERSLPPITHTLARAHFLRTIRILVAMAPVTTMLIAIEVASQRGYKGPVFRFSTSLGALMGG